MSLVGGIAAAWPLIFVCAAARQDRADRFSGLCVSYRVCKIRGILADRSTRSVTAYQKLVRSPLGGVGFLRVHPMRIIVAARHAGSPSMRLRKSPAQFPIRPYVFVCCTKIWSR